jgi:hypothetical protein
MGKRREKKKQGASFGDACGSCESKGESKIESD